MTSAHSILIYQVFDWTSDDGAHQVRFWATPILEAIAKGTLPHEKLAVLLDREWCRLWLTKRDPDIIKVRAFTQAQIDEPVLGIEIPERHPNGHPTILLIDGSHRMYRRYLDNYEDCLWHVVRYPHWLPYSESFGKPLPTPTPKTKNKDPWIWI
jgi:hypothetical protein